MEDAHTAHTHQNGIVDEIGHGVEGFVAAHAAHINVLVELLPSVVYRLARGAVHRHGGPVFKGGLVGMLQTVGTHLGAHVAEHYSGCLAVGLLNRAYGAQTFYPHTVAHFQHFLLFCFLDLLGLLRSLGRLALCLLLAAAVAALLAFLYLAYLARHQLFVGLRVYLQHFLLKLVQVFTQLAGRFALGLALAYLADGVFYLAVRLAKQFLGFFFRLRQYLPAAFLQPRYLLFVAGSGLLHLFLLLVYLLPLAFPVALVAHNVLQVFVALDIVGAHYLAGVSDHFLRYAGLASYLYGKRTARTPYLQLEKGAHLVAVV